jgi:hypothetical protein
VVILFGVFLLAMIALIALAWALPLGTLVSYGVALVRARAGEGIGTRLAVQLGVATLAVGALTALFVAVLIAVWSGNAGSGVRVFGVDVFDTVLLTPALATPLVIFVGEVALFARRRAIATGRDRGAGGAP